MTTIIHHSNHNYNKSLDFNEQMRSQYFKQVETETFPKKSSVHEQAKRKIINQTAARIAQTQSKNFKSQKPSMANSIGYMKKSRQDKDLKMRVSYSKPTLPIQTEVPKYDATWVDLKCLECQSLKAQQAKRMKELQMLYEQQLTEEKQKFIMMEKKYLLKESDHIKLLAEYERLSYQYSENQNDYQILRLNFDETSENLKKIQIQHNKMADQIKNKNEKIQNLHHFLKQYVDQTKIIINWAHLFQQIHQELPTIMQLVKEDLLIRKMDLQITLKEATTFQRLNFSQISLNKEDSSSFLDDDSGCQAFMKYLKQEPKTRSFHYSTSAKKGRSMIDSFSNKQNIDFINGISIKSLLNSRLNDTKSKQKGDMINDDCLRVLLLQAKTIQSSLDFKGDSIKENSRSIVQDLSEEKSAF